MISFYIDLAILDRFHIMKKFNEAIDKMRRIEHRDLKENGKEEILKNSRWALLKNTENLTEKQSLKLKLLVSENLKTFNTDFHSKKGPLKL